MQKVSTEAMMKFLVWLRNPLDDSLSAQERITMEEVVRRRQEWIRLVWRYKMDQMSLAERAEARRRRGSLKRGGGDTVSASENGTMGIPAKKGLGIFLDRPGGDGVLLLYTVCYELGRL